MSFWLDRKAIELKGMKLTPSVVEESEKVCKATVAKGKWIFLQIMCIRGEEQDDGNVAELYSALLDDFKEVFDEPLGLPLPCSHDHQIVLKEGTQPIAIAPYWYMYYRKIDIEKMVAELLRSRVIRPSSSPFSAPILLVRKADGS